MHVDNIKKSIARALLSNHKNIDVKVILDRVHSGIWLWEEHSKSHVHFLFEEIIDILGFSTEFKNYIDNLPIYETSWRFINPQRLNEAFG